MTPVLPSTAPIELLRRMKAWLANLLEVPIDAAWWLWLGRLLVRPATPGAGMFSSLVRGIYRLLSALWWLVAAVIKVTGTLLYAGAWPIRVATYRMRTSSTTSSSIRISIAPWTIFWQSPARNACAGPHNWYGMRRCWARFWLDLVVRAVLG